MEHTEGSIRINKALSEQGFCSRRQADVLVEAGRVTINGRKAILGDRVLPEDIILVDGQSANKKQSDVFIAFNKPVGITCTTDQTIPGNIISYINYPERIFHVGRLDKPSEGLIFLTNNGDIVNKILRAGNKHEKEYIVTVDRPITKEFVDRMAGGIPILGTVTKKCKVERLSRFVFRIVLIQGLNRQIRRMCEYLGYEVTRLQRVRIMNITLEGIPEGKWRDLTAKELAEIEAMVSDSSKVAAAQTPKKRRRRRN